MAIRQLTGLFLTLFGIASALLRGQTPQSPSNGDRHSGTAVRVVEDEASFTDFKLRHGRAYEQGSEEHTMRLELFRRRAAEVERLNSRPGRLWTAGINALSDRTEQELSALKGWKSSHARDDDDDDKEMLAEFETAKLPESSDWLKLSNMDFIRDQGSCGSCWAVTSTTVLAAHSEIHATNRSFSTQEVVDCVPNPNACGGTGGCQGATVELAFQYVMMVGSEEPTEYGAYTATDGTCSWTPTDKTEPSMAALSELGTKAKIFHAPENAPGLTFGMKGWQKLPSNTAKPLMYAVHNYGPVAVALAANDIMMYDSGVFNGCDDWVVNHAVTLIGYGVDKKLGKYWLIQNSWGSMWGESGRIRLHRTDDEDGNCGMDHDPQAGIACKGEEEPVKVCGTCGVLYDSIVPRFDAGL